MAKKTGITNFSFAQDFLKRVGGDFAVGVVDACESKRGKVKDEDLAKKMGLKVTEVRTILNRLHYRGIAYYQKKKNKKTGWYTYTWGIKLQRVIDLIFEEQKEEIGKLQSSQEMEETYTYFECKKNCTSVPFAVAAEFQFKCPECNSTMVAVNSKKRLKKISKRIDLIKKELEEIQKTHPETQKLGQIR